MYLSPELHFLCHLTSIHSFTISFLLKLKYEIDEKGMLNTLILVMLIIMTKQWPALQLA